MKDINYIEQQEINKINVILLDTYNTKIIEYWIPAKDLLEKTCIFIMLKDQTTLCLKHSKLELDLYILLKNNNFFLNSKLFDSIALF